MKNFFRAWRDSWMALSTWALVVYFALQLIVLAFALAVLLGAIK